MRVLSDTSALLELGAGATKHQGVYIQPAKKLVFFMRACSRGEVLQDFYELLFARRLASYSPMILCFQLPRPKLIAYGM